MLLTPLLVHRHRLDGFVASGWRVVVREACLWLGLSWFGCLGGFCVESEAFVYRGLVQPLCPDLLGATEVGL